MQDSPKLKELIDKPDVSNLLQIASDGLDAIVEENQISMRAALCLLHGGTIDDISVKAIHSSSSSTVPMTVFNLTTSKLTETFHEDLQANAAPLESVRDVIKKRRYSWSYRR